MATGIIETLQEKVAVLEAKVDALQELDKKTITEIAEIKNVILDIDARLDKLEEAPIPVPPDPTPTPEPTGFKMGVNLHELKTWSRELPFANVMMNASPWINCMAATPTNPWDLGGSLPPLSAMGLPTGNLPTPDGKTIRTILFCKNGMKYPKGPYSISFTGNGTVQLKCGAKTTNFTHPGGGGTFFGTFEVETLDNDGIHVVILKNEATNPIKELTVNLPEKTGMLDLNERFENFMKPFKMVRFMGMMQTNNSPVTDECVLNYTIPHPKNGAPIYKLVDLASELSVDPWFCLPHLSTEKYVKDFAEALKSTILLPTIYIEYSNELWNGSFGQTKWVMAQTGAQPSEFATKMAPFIAAQAVSRFKIIENVFGSERSRLKFVVAGQNANTGVMTSLLNEFDKLGFKYDVISSAPYFSENSDTHSTNVDTILTNCEKYLKEKTIPGMQWHINKAKEQSTKLGKKVEYQSYEGGEHLVPGKDLPYTNAYIQAQSQPKMGELTKALIAAAKPEAGGFNYFESCYLNGEFGCWGLVQSTEEDPMASVKYKAVVDATLG